MRRHRLVSLFGVCVLLTLVVSTGVVSCAPCSSILPIPGGEPEIHFWAHDEMVPPGDCTLLRWEVIGAEGYPVFLNGEQVPSGGEEEVCLDETTTFELVVGAPGGPHEETVTVRVEGPGEGGPESIALVTDPDAIPQGGCAILFWEVWPPDFAVFLDGREVEPTGEREVCPQQTTTYELVVEAPGAEEVRTVTLMVEPVAGPASPGPATTAPPTTAPSAPPTTAPQPAQGPNIKYFRANGQAGSISASSGSTVTLSWDWERVSEGYLDPGNIALACPSMPCTYQVNPTQNTTYTLRAVNPSGTDTETVTVNVTGPATTLTFTFSPTAGLAGSDVTLYLSAPVPVTVYFDGQPLPKTVIDDMTLGVTVPGNATHGEHYFELRWDGNSVTASQPFYVTTPIVIISPKPTAQGDLVLEDAFLATTGELVLRVGNSPSGSLTGSFEYRVVATATSVVVAQDSPTIPTGSQAFWTGYKPGSGATVVITIDPWDNIPETNENNNQMTKTF